MTDFTGNIETTAESLEALQGDLETHLEGIFGVDIDVEAPTLASGGDGLPTSSMSGSRSQAPKSKLRIGSASTVSNGAR